MAEKVNIIYIPENSENKFSLSETPVTQKLYAEVMGKNPSEYRGKGENLMQPVECVNWYDAVAFCNTLSMQEGLAPYYVLDGNTDPAKWGEPPTSVDTAWKFSTNPNADGYRLPSFSEWKCAIELAGDYIDSTIAARAWYEENSMKRPQKVGSKEADKFGLHDMLGNVWEWCDDAGMEAGTKTVCGGAFCTPADELPGAKTERLAHKRYTDCGFRLCKNVNAHEETPSSENQKEEIKCAQCGAPLKADAKFCGACGARQETKKEDEAHQSPAKTPSDKNDIDNKTLQELTKKNSKLKKRGIIAWVLFGIAMFAIIIQSIEITGLQDSESSSIRSEKYLSDNWDKTLESPVKVIIDSVYNHANGSTKLVGKEITYLEFRYTVLKTAAVANSENLYIKIITKNDSISRGNTSPQGYTSSVKMNSTVSNWGTDMAGSTYSYGRHIIEFWYKDACVGRKSVWIN